MQEKDINPWIISELSPTKTETRHRIPKETIERLISGDIRHTDGTTIVNIADTIGNTEEEKTEIAIQLLLASGFIVYHGENPFVEKQNLH